MEDEEWMRRERALDRAEEKSWWALIASIVAFMFSCFVFYVKVFT